MRELQYKRYIARLIYSRYTILALLILIAFMGKAAFGAYGKYKRSSEAREIAAAEVARLEEREKALEADIAALNTREGEEREIREKLGFVKEGEQLVILIENETATSSKPREKGFWERFFDIFE